MRFRVDYFGYVIEPFNMRKELEVGDVARDGSYVVDVEKRNESKLFYLNRVIKIY